MLPADDPDDNANVIRRPGEPNMIRGPIAPINVLEPLLSLQDGISGLGQQPGQLRAVPTGNAEENQRRQA